MKKASKSILLRTMLICLSIIATTATHAQTKSVVKESNTFHRRFKASQFDAIYANASLRLRERFTKNEFVEKLRKDASRLGPLKSISDTGFPPPNPVSALAKDFEHKALVFLVKGSKTSHYEVLIWDLTNGYPKLAVYNTDYGARPVSN